ncbi:MAG TPA: hypothetical protein VHW00_17590 [Thermoanaerobaculia bacterium]|nr:hypothetical protein [Thermoanaerobaculia bacterium]
MQETAVEAPPKATHGFRNFMLVVLLLAGAFGGGYIPQRLALHRTQESLATLQREHALTELHRRLGVASHEAMRNNYASAAEAAKTFFNGCGEVLDQYPLEDQPRTRNTLTTWMASRDTLLARLAAGDPATREQLAGMYLALDGVLARHQ